MATIEYKSISDLQPLEVRYQFNRDENLKIDTVSYYEGYNVNYIHGLNNFQDIAFNKNTCLLLTSATSLSSFFNKPDSNNIGKLPGTIKIQTRDNSSTCAQYVAETNTIALVEKNNNNETYFFIQPVDNSNEIEIRQGDLYMQVDEAYPYAVRFGKKILDTDQDLYRQRFTYFYKNGLLTLKTKTKDSGYRYIAFCSDGVMRATGLVLNNVTINDYVLSAVSITNNELTRNFIPTNNWVTYFLDFSSQTNNSNVNICQSFNDTPVNFLITFPFQEAITTGKTNINIANLKTGLTPAGGPPQIDNTYSKTVVTTNKND